MRNIQISVHIVITVNHNQVVLVDDNGNYQLPGGICSGFDGSHDFLLGQVKQKLSGVVQESSISKVQLQNAFFGNNEESPHLHLLYTLHASESELYNGKIVNITNLQQYLLDKIFTIEIEKILSPTTAEIAVEEKAKIDDKKTSRVDELIIYTDGGSRGNPGPSASGFVIKTTNEEVIEEGGEYLGLTTNNQAEYQAVKLALEKAMKYYPKKVLFRIDSELVVRQINGQYKIRNRDLWPVHVRIKELMSEIPSVTFVHVRREFNKEADAKVNEILDSRE